MLIYGGRMWKPLWNFVSIGKLCAVQAVLGCLVVALPSGGQNTLPLVSEVEVQPLLVHVERLRQALDYLGAPLSDDTTALLDQAADTSSAATARRLVQQALDPLCLAIVSISPEARVKVSEGPGPRELDHQGWQVFLVKVENQAGSTASLRAQSAQAEPVPNAEASQVRDRWLEMEMFQDPPLGETLSGIRLEYRPLLLYSRDSGKRAAVISFDIGQGTQDIGFRNDVALTFDCRSATTLTLRIRDSDGSPTTAALEIRDQLGRVYPSQAKRLAPDFFFHPQIYRTDGETLQLPVGNYTITCTRGPEYLPIKQEISVGDEPKEIVLRLDRWIDPSERGWWSGDHHIHAAGCAHYTNPTEGVHAMDMARHCQGEDLKVGANLTWGPCFDYQKQFFTGEIDKSSRYPYLLRYDVEVSGFGSHVSGHLCLLRLNDQIPPGGDSKDHWPTLCLNTLRWAQKQGAVCGPAHSGWGLEADTDELPNYIVPPFDGIGANEYVVDVTHQVEGPDGNPVPAVDFMSMCDTPYVWELNMWYHTLNCGFTTRISGETDFPCIYGERVGLGRSYVKLPLRLTYDGWCEGVSRGACYVSDGRSHLMDFQVNDARLGEADSELRLDSPSTIIAQATVAAYLPESPEPEIRQRSYTRKPYWHLERARTGDSRDVEVELIVNGRPVASRSITADGSVEQVTLETSIDQSSWVAMRVLGSSHTNPIFVMIDDKPIRASRRSARWCREGVDRCWQQKERAIAAAEIADARAAYDHARRTYDRIMSECTVD